MIRIDTGYNNTTAEFTSPVSSMRTLSWNASQTVTGTGSPLLTPESDDVHAIHSNWKSNFNYNHSANNLTVLDEDFDDNDGQEQCVSDED